MPNSLFLVAEAERKIVGALTCGGGTLKADRHMTALGIYVAKDWRDRGMGNALMARCVEWANASPVVERVELEVYAKIPARCTCTRSTALSEKAQTPPVLSEWHAY